MIGRNHDAICQLQSSYKVHLITISNGELSDPPWSSVNILTVRFWYTKKGFFRVSTDFFSFEELNTAVISRWKNILYKCLPPLNKRNKEKNPMIYLLRGTHIKIKEIQHTLIVEPFYSIETLWVFNLINISFLKRRIHWPCSTVESKHNNIEMQFMFFSFRSLLSVFTLIQFNDQWQLTYITINTIKHGSCFYSTLEIAHKR